jgi:DNA-binding NtrC family response regulator
VAAEKIHLIVTDFVRPGKLNGLQFIEAFKKVHPAVPIIMVSAVNNRRFNRWALRLRARACLRKPFVAMPFLAAVDDALFQPPKSQI